MRKYSLNLLQIPKKMILKMWSLVHARLYIQLEFLYLGLGANIVKRAEKNSKKISYLKVWSLVHARLYIQWEFLYLGANQSRWRKKQPRPMQLCRSFLRLIFLLFYFQSLRSSPISPPDGIIQYPFTIPDNFLYRPIGHHAAFSLSSVLSIRVNITIAFTFDQNTI